MIEELVSHVFAARNAAHLAHWATKSYAEHVALGDFYDGAIDALDKVVEAYQGRFGLIKEVRIMSMPAKNFTAHLKVEMDWIESNRDKIAKKNTAVQNLIDELIALYATTHYKLVNLS